MMFSLITKVRDSYTKFYFDIKLIPHPAFQLHILIVTLFKSKQNSHNWSAAPVPWHQPLLFYVLSDQERAGQNYQ